jgi:carboxypeptidase family protein
MVSEARRLFGPKAHTGAAMAGPVAAGLPVGLNEGGTRCAWSGEEVRRVERPSTGVIEGTVRTESSGRPIAGAFLQLLGSGSATFADGSGRYRLTFDPALVDVCRSQLVRVTAPGFRARTMILGLGFQSDNVIDLAVRP